MTTTTTKSNAEDEDNRFGACPICGKNDGYLNVRSDHWFFCDQHRVRWCSASNLFSAWRDQTEAQQRREFTRIEDYTVIGGYCDQPMAAAHAPDPEASPPDFDLCDCGAQFERGEPCPNCSEPSPPVYEIRMSGAGEASVTFTDGNGALQRNELCSDLEIIMDLLCCTYNSPLTAYTAAHNALGRSVKHAIVAFRDINGAHEHQMKAPVRSPSDALHHLLDGVDRKLESERDRVHRAIRERIDAADDLSAEAYRLETEIRNAGLHIALEPFDGIPF